MLKKATAFFIVKLTYFKHISILNKFYEKNIISSSGFSGADYCSRTSTAWQTF